MFPIDPDQPRFQRGLAWTRVSWRGSSRLLETAKSAVCSDSSSKNWPQQLQFASRSCRFHPVSMTKDLPEVPKIMTLVGSGSIIGGTESRRRLPASTFPPQKMFVAHEQDTGPTAPGGGSGGARKQGRGDGEHNDDGGSAGLRPELEALLEKEARSISSLPTEFQGKIFDGSLTSSDLTRFFDIEKTFLIGALARIWPALRSRLVANPRFLSVMAVELIIGFFSKTAAEMKQRGSSFWSEFDFYTSDIMLELVGDFALVWLLSPTLMDFRASSRAKSAFLGLSGHLQQLPKFALQPGTTFSPGQRLACLIIKGLQFGLVGFCASVVGHSLTKGLVRLRRSLRPQSAENNVKLAPVLANSLSWGAFMALSSNMRYQAVSAIEARVLEPLLVGAPALLFTAISFLLRSANTFIGGIHWIYWAKWSGVQ